jgi:predicted pyridoxine 5'-phosphate oxidase superfamily flavin-nucleotide-binding protein
METDVRHRLTRHEHVAEVLGTPPDFVVAKLGDHVDEPARKFIALAPLVFLATHDGKASLPHRPEPHRGRRPNGTASAPSPVRKPRRLITIGDRRTEAAWWRADIRVSSPVAWG